MVSENQNILSDTDTNFRNLAREIREQRAVLFVGSGFSVNTEPNPGTNARMLLWDELKKRFGAEMGMNDSDIQKTAAPRLIQIYENRFGIRRRNQILREAIPDDKVGPSELHKKLLEIGWKSIVTTNIDTLIERTLQKLGIGFTTVVQENDFSRLEARIPVYKIHGSFENEPTWVFSESEYHSNLKSLFIDKLKTIFAECTVVFIGYGINDPDVDAVLYHIRDRIGQNQKRSFFITESESDFNKDYWRDRNIEVISRKEISILSTIDFDEGQRICSENVEDKQQEFLNVVLDKLIEFLKGESFHVYSRSDYLWEITRLEPAIRQRTGQALEIVRSCLHDLAQRIPFHASYEIIADLSQDIDNDLNIKECCNLIQEIISLREIEEFQSFSIQINKVLFDFDTGSINDSEQIILLMKVIMIHSIGSDEYYDYAIILIRSLCSALNDRLHAGILPGISGIEIRRTLLFIRRFLRKNSNSKLRYAAIEMRTNLFFVRYAWGRNLNERHLPHAIDILLKEDCLNDEDKALLEYRKGISAIYTCRWDYVEGLLYRADGIPSWRRLWSAFFYAELGLKEKATILYNKIFEESPILRERYIAVQSLEVLNHTIRGSELHNRNKIQNDLQQYREKREKVLTEAHGSGFRIEQYDFIESRKSNFRSKILKSALEAAAREKYRKIKFTQYYYQNPFFPVFDEFDIHWLNGVPSFNLKMKELSDLISYFWDVPGTIFIVDEIKNILPFFEDFAKTGIVKHIQQLAWQNPVNWVTLQKRWINQMVNLLDYFKATEILKNCNDTPVHRRIYSLLSLTSLGVPIFSNYAQESIIDNIIVRFNKEFDRWLTKNDTNISNSISRLFNGIFQRLSIKKRAELIESNLKSVFFSFSGRWILDRLSDYLNIELWTEFSEETRALILKGLDENIQTSPYDCFPFLYLLKGEAEYSDHPIYIAFKIGMDNYREKELGEKKEELERNNTPYDDVYHKDHLKQEIDALDNRDDYSFQEYRDILNHLKIPEIVEPGYSLKEWVSSLDNTLQGQLSSNELNPITYFIKTGEALKNQEILDPVLIRLFERIDKTRERNYDTESWYRGLLNPIGKYYLATERIEQWLTLWEKYEVFEGWFNDKTQPISLREIEERNQNPEGLSESLFNLYLMMTHERDKNRIINFLYFTIESMKMILDSDVRLLKVLWNANEIKNRYTRLPVMLLMKLYSLDPERIEVFIPRFLTLLFQASEIEIEPYLVKDIKDLLEATSQIWDKDEELSIKARKALRKIEILDLREPEVI